MVFSGIILTYILFAGVAQSVERGTENPCVRGSIPRPGNFFMPEFL